MLAWRADGAHSRCIDAGDPSSDWEGELWPHGGRVNMGAYGGTPEASMSLSLVGNVADLNGDGVVDWVDYAWMARYFDGRHPQAELGGATQGEAGETPAVQGEAGGPLAADLDRDGVVGILDLWRFGQEWLWGK